MKEKLEKIRNEGLKKINDANNVEELQEVRRELTGKKSELSEVLKSIGSLTPNLKKEIGIQTTGV